MQEAKRNGYERELENESSGKSTRKVLKGKYKVRKKIHMKDNDKKRSRNTGS